MTQPTFEWHDAGEAHRCRFVRVDGTRGDPYQFGGAESAHHVNVDTCWMSETTVTRALWSQVMSLEERGNPADGGLPMTDVSWRDLHAPSGFFARLNQSVLAEAFRDQLSSPVTLRLPTETEWEYAARGGPRWRDGFTFSGSHAVDAVAWYDRRHGDHSMPVARKAPNQLGLYDMSGNVWEWCADTYTPDVHDIPRNGSAFVGDGDERVLRGGCFHNWAEHCTVSKRYAIGAEFHDGCIGFRIVLHTAIVR